jgi:hypothetical protein
MKVKIVTERCKLLSTTHGMKYVKLITTTTTAAAADAARHNK